MKKNVYVIIDGQAGSCGKGKVIGQFAIHEDVDVAISNCMPNAGHTFEQDGKRRLFRNIPVSAVNPRTKLFIGHGSVIDMNVLEQEYEENKDILEGREIIVHPLVPLIESRHIEEEKRRIKTGSTLKGCAACMSEKIMRDPNLKFFKEYKNIKADPDYHRKFHDALNSAEKVLVEGSQGCDLSLNNINTHPYGTSRTVSVSQMLSDSKIPPSRLKKTIMVIRPYAIRISNEIYDGSYIYSGDYGTSEELDWNQVNVGSYLHIPAHSVDEKLIEEYLESSPRLNELTSVTKKQRRIFPLDINLLKENIEDNDPAELYLNFFEHLDYGLFQESGFYSGVSEEDISLDRYQREYLNWLESELGVPITMLGTGPDLNHYIDRRPYVKR
ncbi:MAG: adenylosuccinate synthetase, partial [Bacilli bacterium]|nr:adenylosuccinate synthetase [Bacilli bacterium]